MQCKRFILLALYPQSTFGFSSIPSNDIKIVGLPGGKIESLPAMYVESFQRWIIKDNHDNDCQDKQLKLQQILGAGFCNDEGWVNPTTTDKLWWPADISTLQTRPMLNVLFKNGILSYVSMGLDVRVPYAGENGVVTTWRNYGLKSQPIARIWTTLDIAMEKIFHVEGFIVQHQKESEEMKHEELFQPIYASRSIKEVANLFAEADEPSLAKGFHIVSFPMSKYWTDLSIPTPKLGKDDSNAYKIVCFATSEPFASKLLELDEDILEMSATSVLEVKVERTEGGGKSEYLPEVYKGLYLQS